MLVDHDLSPSQERNLEREVQCRVIGRTGLILDIFAQRARSSEAAPTRGRIATSPNGVSPAPRTALPPW